MHYTQVRSLIMAIPSYHMTELHTNDCHPSFYVVETMGDYKISLSPFYRWLYVYKDGKLIGKLVNRCHERYIVAFQRKILCALHDGAECTDYIRECFIDDINSEPCQYR